MIINVTNKNFYECLKDIEAESFISCDTETTGLSPFKGDRLFSIVFATLKNEYYFNFQAYLEESTPLLYDVIPLLQPIFNGDRCIFMHNAKFDMHFLHKEGIEFNCDIHDTQVSARLLSNNELSYSLDACVKRELNEEKDDAVKKWCLDNEGGWEWEHQPGKKSKKKRYFFSKVPFSIICPYACKDARLTLSLGIKHLTDIHLYDDTVDSDKYPKRPFLYDVMLEERRTTKTCFRIEQVGILIDKEYCKEAIEYETARYLEAAQRFKEETGEELVDSGQKLSQVLEKLGYKISYTDKQSPSVDDEFLSKLDTDVAKYIQTYRDSYKRCNTYFRSFLHFADPYNVIHAEIRQAGTATGRFSYKDPNLQNLTSSDEKEKYPVRKAFIPRPGHCFVMIDYNQMEFRMMLDYAGEIELIDKIIEGHDPHQATADLTGLDRRSAKTLNFGILYGMGAKKLANALDITEINARQFKRKYFKALEKVEDFILQVTIKAKTRGYLFDWTGRRFLFPDAKWAYKGINAIIQGGAASTIKKAMNTLDLALPKYGVQMLIQIHDEVVFEVPLDSLEVVEMIKTTLESSFRHRLIPLTCSVSHSLRSLGEDQEGLPVGIDGKEARDSFQREDLSSTQELTEFLGTKNTATVH